MRAVLVIILLRIMCHFTAQKVYNPREPENSPFFQLISRNFDEFKRIYPDKYKKTFGFWRPVIRRSIDKFIKCGELREGFTRVKCTSCDKEMFIPFSCPKRCCCWLITLVPRTTIVQFICLFGTLYILLCTSAYFFQFLWLD